MTMRCESSTATTNADGSLSSINDISPAQEPGDEVRDLRRVERAQVHAQAAAQHDVDAMILALRREQHVTFGDVDAAAPRKQVGDPVGIDAAKQGDALEQRPGEIGVGTEGLETHRAHGGFRRGVGLDPSERRPGWE